MFLPLEDEVRFFTRCQGPRSKVANSCLEGKDSRRGEWWEYHGKAFEFSSGELKEALTGCCGCSESDHLSLQEPVTHMGETHKEGPYILASAQGLLKHLAVVK